MCFKANREEDRARARERLAKVRPQERQPSQASSRPRGNREVDRHETERAEERLMAVVGR